MPSPCTGANSREHTRHLTVAGLPSRSSRRRLQAARTRARPFFRHGSEQYRTERLAGENSLAHSLHRMRGTSSLPSLALRRAVDARRRAAWTARLSGSARYRRMYSRIRARFPSARQGGEQYTCGLPGLMSVWNAPPQMRHLTVRMRPGGEAGAAGCGPAGGGAAGAEAAAAMAILRRRACLFFLHASEQYRTDRLGVSNAPPHSLHRTRCTLPTSLSAFFPHLAQ